MIPHAFIFIVSCFLILWAGRLLVISLVRITRFLEWREFVVAFFVMAFVGAIPNLFVGISSALHGIPQLSFGDIVGGNVIDLTLAIAISTLFVKEIPAKSRTVQTTSIFTISIAILPMLLILDGILGRGDGLLLIGAFGFYLAWLFSKKERFTRVFDSYKVPILKEFKVFLRDLGKGILAIILLFGAAEGVVSTASFLAERLNLSIVTVGILIVSLGNSLPETFFAIASARSGQTWMILGDLMGSVIIPSTLVLGIVALIFPIKIINFPPFVIARIFLILSALIFLFFIRTEAKITKKEAVYLLSLYVLFVACELLI
jgi:cation:H+ antiporter